MEDLSYQGNKSTTFILSPRIKIIGLIVTAGPLDIYGIIRIQQGLKS